MCFDSDSLPPIPVISGAAVSARRPRAGGARREPARGLRSHAGRAQRPRRAQRHGDRDPAGHPRPVPLLRGAGAALRRAQPHRGRDRLLRSAPPVSRSAATTSSGSRTSSRRRPRASRPTRPPRSPGSATPAALGLHRRLLLRRPALVARRRGRARPRAGRSASTAGPARGRTVPRARLSAPATWRRRSSG